MADHSLSQVEDRLLAVVAAWPALSGIAVTIAGSEDVAFEGDGLIIATMSYAPDVFEEGNNCLIHKAAIEIESVRHAVTGEWISRTNRNRLAEAHKAVMADRSLGIGLQDIEVDDMAPTEARGKDVDSASLRLNVVWFTPLNDMTVISHT